MGMPDARTLPQIGTRNSSGRDSSTGPVGLIGGRLRRDLLGDKMPAPCDLEAKNARLKQEVKDLKYRTEILEAKSCEQWYSRELAYCR